METRTRSQVRLASQATPCTNPSEPIEPPQVSVPPPQPPHQWIGTRKVTKVLKTTSFSDTFSGRMEWKIRHYEYPVTSTPAPTEKIRRGQKSTILGLRVAHRITEADFSVISPIKKTDNMPSDLPPTTTEQQ